MTMRHVILHGEMGVIYGTDWHLDAHDLPEIIRGINANFPGFQQYVENHDFQIIRGTLEGDDHVRLIEIELGLGKTCELHMIPHIIGAGGNSSGIGKLIAGALLAGFAFFAAPALLGAAGSAGVTIGGMSARQLGMIGIGLMFSGVSSLLSPQPKDAKDDSSKGFSNVPTTAQQGIPVPLPYGRIRTEDMPIIASRITVAQVSMT